MTEIVKDTCKIGQEHDCCRYLIIGGDGFECAKLTNMKLTLDSRGDSMTARADNCDGLDTKTSIQKLNNPAEGESDENL